MIFKTPFNWNTQDCLVYYVAGLFLPFKQNFFDTIIESPLPPGVLMSFITATYYDGKDGQPGRRFSLYEPIMQKVKEAGGMVMLDSGAFTVYAREGYSIDCKKYADFCIAYSDCFNIVVNLDVIGDPVETKVNLKKLEDRGVRDHVTLLPVFHYGSPFEDLYFLAENYNFIGLGGIAKVRTEARTVWLERIMSLKLPVKYHLFGVFSQPEILASNPLSIDSSVWSTSSLLGKMVTEGGVYSIGRHRNAVMTPMLESYLTNQALRYGFEFVDMQDYKRLAIFNWYSCIEIMSKLKKNRQLIKRRILT